MYHAVWQIARFPVLGSVKLNSMVYCWLSRYDVTLCNSKGCNACLTESFWGRAATKTAEQRMQRESMASIFKWLLTWMECVVFFCLGRGKEREGRCSQVQPRWSTCIYGKFGGIMEQECLWFTIILRFSLRSERETRNMKIKHERRRLYSLRSSICFGDS